jgi:hypothetical protein
LKGVHSHCGTNLRQRGAAVQRLSCGPISATTSGASASGSPEAKEGKISACFMVHAQVVDPSVKDAFDWWYPDDHLADAIWRISHI